MVLIHGELQHGVRKRFLEFFHHYFGGLYQRIDQHNLFFNAGGLAFSILVCVMPILLIIFSALGTILTAESIQGQIDSFIDRIIPYADYAQFVKEIIASRLEEIVTYKEIAGVTGVIGLLFASSGLFGSLRMLLNMIYKSEVDKHFVIGKLRDFGMVMVALVVFLASMLFLSGIELLRSVADRVDFLSWLYELSPPDSAFVAISLTVMFVFFSIVYYLIPYARPGKLATTVSALWAAILWEISKQVFGYYITHAVDLGRIYGAYVFILVVVFWLYYSSIVFILGAEIGQLFRERRKLLRGQRRKALAEIEAEVDGGSERA